MMFVMSTSRKSWRQRVIFTQLILWTLTCLFLFAYHVSKEHLNTEETVENRKRTAIFFGNNFVIRRSGEEPELPVLQHDSVADAPEVIQSIINNNLPGLSRAGKIKLVNTVLKTSNGTSQANPQGPYRHDLHYLQYMKCPTTLRHKMAKSKKIKGKYIADVPVLLTPEHVTTAEFRRLKKFRDLMGWKYAKFKEISEAMSLLNTPSNQYLFDNLLINNTLKEAANSTCVRCAVVGNGGILNGSRIGHVIDSHDYVFRTNVAVTEGYEEDVGTKPSFYCFGMKSLSNSVYYMKDKYVFRNPPWKPGIRYVFFPEDDWAYRYISADLTNRTLPKGNNGRYANRTPFSFLKPLVAEDIKIIHPDFCRYVEQSWLRSPKLRNQGGATTGATMLFLALHTCDEVNAFGFMGDPKKYTSHYYDRTFVKSNLTAAAWHDWEAENKLWKLLIDEGILNIYTRS